MELVPPVFGLSPCRRISGQWMGWFDGRIHALTTVRRSGSARKHAPDSVCRVRILNSRNSNRLTQDSACLHYDMKKSRHVCICTRGQRAGITSLDGHVRWRTPINPRPIIPCWYRRRSAEVASETDGWAVSAALTIHRINRAVFAMRQSLIGCSEVGSIRRCAGQPMSGPDAFHRTKSHQVGSTAPTHAHPRCGGRAEKE